MKNIQFIDLDAQRRLLGDKIDHAVMNVINSGAYILGPAVTELEKQLCDFTGAKHTITCASGTDSLFMVLLAKNVGVGDAVFVPTFTFAATAEVVALAGATPIFVDVLPSNFNMDPESLRAAVDMVVSEGKLTPKGIIPVDLFGQPADYDAIQEIADAHGLWVMADAAQSCGATVNGRHTTAICDAGSTSFFPAKPLGCYGDGGAIFTNDDDLANRLLSIRVHGKGKDKYDNVRLGINGRLDTVQAAVLIEKLALFRDELTARQRIADQYNTALADVATVPQLDANKTSSWAQYTLLVDDRDAIVEGLKAKGVPTAIYYPIPLHQQTAYKHFPTTPQGCPVSESLAEKVLSLPMHPYLDQETQDYIIAQVRDVIAQTRKQAA